METKPRAFIIEDNEDQNLVFTTALRQAGYETESIYDGLIAQKRLDEVAPAIIVLDLHLPGMSGEAILKRIRTDQRLARVRVILASADAARAVSLQPQADLTLLKPISFFQLSKLASRFLHRPKPNDLSWVDQSE